MDEDVSLQRGKYEQNRKPGGIHNLISLMQVSSEQGQYGRGWGDGLLMQLGRERGGGGGRLLPF